nr:LysE family translocator [Wenxinia marina]
MLDPLALLAFLPAGLALNLTHGADMMFCLGQGLRGGPRPALAAAAGISTGAMVHVTLAALGLGALVAAHPGAFDVIRWVGVAYLVWLAVQTLHHGVARDVPPVSPRRAFRDGLLVNLTNPKVILFVLAFLPQFTDPSRALLPQFLVLGALLALGGMSVNGAVGVFAGGAGRRLAGSAAVGRWLGRVSALIFLGLAARLAFGRPS